MEYLTEDRPGFAVVDVETTGFVPEEARIVEIGVVVLDTGGREMDAFGSLVDPECDPGPTHVHGITPSMVEGAPTFSGILPYVAALLSGRVVVGHNVDRFDLAFLRAECLRVGGEGLVPGPLPSIDTLRVAQQHLGMRGRASLVDCCSHFGLSWEEHHYALGDAQVTAALFRSVRMQLGDDALGLDAAMEWARGTSWLGRSEAPPEAVARSCARFMLA